MPTVYANSSCVASENRTFQLLDHDEQAGDFREALATAAHELKTPLAVMDGYLHLLLALKLGPLTDKQERYVANVLTSGRNLLRRKIARTRSRRVRLLRFHQEPLHAEFRNKDAVVSNLARGRGGNALQLPNI